MIFNMIVNLISDTVTKPSKLMLEAMLNADVGDDVRPNCALDRPVPLIPAVPYVLIGDIAVEMKCN